MLIPLPLFPMKPSMALLLSLSLALTIISPTHAEEEPTNVEETKQNYLNALQNYKRARLNWEEFHERRADLDFLTAEQIEFSEAKTFTLSGVDAMIHYLNFAEAHIQQAIEEGLVDEVTADLSLQALSQNRESLRQHKEIIQNLSTGLSTLQQESEAVMELWSEPRAQVRVLIGNLMVQLTHDTIREIRTLVEQVSEDYDERREDYDERRQGFIESQLSKAENTLESMQQELDEIAEYFEEHKTTDEKSDSFAEGYAAMEELNGELLETKTYLLELIESDQPAKENLPQV